MCALALLAAGLVLCVVRWRHWAARVTAALMVMLVGVAAGVVGVNDYFGYYTSWSQAYDGTLGSPSTTPTSDPRRSTVVLARQGELRSIMLPGAASHISRPGYIYLPPQYSQRRYQAVRFPVVELLHGTPGGPWNWRDQLHIAATLDALMAQRAIGPMVFVIPQVSVGASQECLDHGAVLDDTYVSRDVPNDVRHQFRVSHNKAEWALFGYSSGGYCAANLALRHRTDFGAAASMDGYYWPSDGPAGARLRGDAAATAANDPLARASALPVGSVPMPQFWISAGSGYADDLTSARAFVAALSHLERVTSVVQPGARHNFYSWNDETPVALSWLWDAIAPPDLRVAFPTVGAPHTVTVSADPRASRRTHHRHHVAPTPPPSRSSRPPKSPRSSPPPRPLPSAGLAAVPRLRSG